MVSSSEGNNEMVSKKKEIISQIKPIAEEYDDKAPSFQHFASETRALKPG
jgi:hypothetical protein